MRVEAMLCEVARHVVARGVYAVAFRLALLSERIQPPDGDLVRVNVEQLATQQQRMVAHQHRVANIARNN